LTGRFFDAEFEWVGLSLFVVPFLDLTHLPSKYAHEILARAAGLNEEIIMSVKANTRPTTMDAVETSLYNFFTELLHTRRVSDEVFKSFKEHIGGEKPLMELVGLVGIFGARLFRAKADTLISSARTTLSSAFASTLTK
jgi:hypothetical protein